MMFRRIAWRQIRSLDDPRAVAFMREDAARNVKAPAASHGIPPRQDAVMWLANFVIECSDFWPLYVKEWRNAGIVGQIMQATSSS
jgi:hypothetical protein